MPNTQDNWEERFDKQFGKQDPDDEYASIGRHAGCDDCRESIKIREEHKQFASQELTRAREEQIRETCKRIRNDFNSENDEDWKSWEVSSHIHLVEEAMLASLTQSQQETVQVPIVGTLNTATGEIEQKTDKPQ